MMVDAAQDQKALRVAMENDRAASADKGDKKPRGQKAPLYLVPFAPLVWIARVMQGGNALKYARGNWKLPVPGETPRQKAQEYLRAAVGHLWAEMENGERIIEGGAEGLALDTGEGGLGTPHLANAATTLFMAIWTLINAGLAPADPGKPWEKKENK
jgi:hypothetical protein